MAEVCKSTYKILVLGDSNVGKSCMMHRFCDKLHYDTYVATIGVDLKQKIVDLDGEQVKVQIWDTAGHERFRTLTTSYYRGANGVLLMYDVTNSQSFQNLIYWMDTIKENASPYVVKVIAGNKCDAVNSRRVSIECGQAIADNFDIPFYEVSCKDNINVEEAFMMLIRLIKNSEHHRMENPSTSHEALRLENDQSTSWGGYCRAC